jgi:hypothetical protein
VGTRRAPAVLLSEARGAGGGGGGGGGGGACDDIAMPGPEYAAEAPAPVGGREVVGHTGRGRDPELPPTGLLTLADIEKEDEDEDEDEGMGGCARANCGGD